MKTLHSFVDHKAVPGVIAVLADALGGLPPGGGIHTARPEAATRAARPRIPRGPGCGWTAGCSGAGYATTRRSSRPRTTSTTSNGGCAGSSRASAAATTERSGGDPGGGPHELRLAALCCAATAGLTHPP